MSDEDYQREARYIDTLSTDRRRAYMHEAEKARGVEVAAKLRAALIAFWRSIK
jgi:hypothetical protein